MLRRIITGMTTGLLTLWWIIYAPLTLFSFIGAVIVLCGTWEWSAFMKLRKNLYRVFIVVLMGIITGVVYILMPIETLWEQGELSIGAGSFFVLSLLWWFVATILVLAYPHMSWVWNASVVIRAGAGVLTLIPSLLALNALRSAEYYNAQYYGSTLIIIVFGIVISTDAGAYFVGKYFGKHKLIPKVSPNKTIEGLLGGIIASVIFIVLFCYYSGIKPHKWLMYTTMTIVIALLSVIGDLLESMLKREAGLKESGFLLPGHGGVLDRIDSLTATLPTFALCYSFIKPL